MSFEVLPEGTVPNSTKHTISLWFRVPSASIKSARDEFQAYRAAFVAAGSSSDPNFLPMPPMLGIVPLMTFGKRGTLQLTKKATGFEEVGSQTGIVLRFNCADDVCDFVPKPLDPSFSHNPSTQDFFNPTSISVDSKQILDPSFIGIDCRGDQNLFAWRFQYDRPEAVPIASGDMFQGITGVDAPFYTSYGGGVGSCVGDCEPPPQFTVVREDQTFFCWDALQSYTFSILFGDMPPFWWEPTAYAAFPSSGDTFGDTIDTPTIRGTGVFRAGGFQPPGNGFGHVIEPDHWHHVLLSIDMSEVAVKNTFGDFGGGPLPLTYPRGTFTNGSKIWLAIDDVNLKGPEISYYTVGDNDLLTVDAFRVMTAVHDTHFDDSGTFNNCDGNSFRQVNVGLTQTTYKLTPPDFPVRKINIPGDAVTTRKVEMACLQWFTGVTINTSSPDNRRGFITEDGKPAKPSDAEDLMGKPPALSFPKRSNWKTPLNAGSTHVSGNTQDGVVTGDIDSYKPDPSLNGPQSGSQG